jgi:putative nucleotidyltransferase with HDIG domain
MVDRILKSVEELPAAPDVAWRVLRIVSSNDYDGDDLLRAVEVDPSITSLVLKTVNSSLYGLRQPAGSLKQAIVLLGGGKIVDLVVALSSAEFFTSLRGGYVLERRGLWRHSVAAANAAEIVASRTGADHGGLAFTAGLLHDLGKIVLNAFIDQTSGELLDRAEKGEESFLTAERRVLGTDHCEIGGLVAERWKMPEVLVEAIRNHHTPESAAEGPARTLARLTHVADVAALSMGIGLGTDGLCYRLDPDSLDALGIENGDLSRLSIEILDRLRETEEALQV